MPSTDPQRLPVDEATAEAVSKAFKLEGFFPEFKAEHCMKLFPRSGLQHFRAGEKLVEQGEPGRDLLLILAGRAKVEISVDSLSAELNQLSDGAVLGEMALLSDGVRSATVRAVSPVFAYRLAFDDLGYVLQNNPDLGEHLKALARARTAR